MPLFEYRCLGCGREFEVLVASGETPRCPSCGSAELKKLLSAFATAPSSSRAPFPDCGGCGAAHSAGCSCSSCCPHAH